MSAKDTPDKGADADKGAEKAPARRNRPQVTLKVTHKTVAFGKDGKKSEK